MTEIEFEQTPIGQRVCTITGPGQFPQPDLCDREGTIISKKESFWGNYFVVQFDDGDIDMMHSISKKGIGFYLL